MLRGNQDSDYSGQQFINLKIFVMGYMGFGMQRWIYTQRARRPFTRIRSKLDFKPGYNKPDSSVSSFLYYINYITSKRKNTGNKREEMKHHCMISFRCLGDIVYPALGLAVLCISILNIILTFIY